MAEVARRKLAAAAAAEAEANALASTPFEDAMAEIFDDKKPAESNDKDVEPDPEPEPEAEVEDKSEPKPEPEPEPEEQPEEEEKEEEPKFCMTRLASAQVLQNMIRGRLRLQLVEAEEDEEEEASSRLQRMDTIRQLLEGDGEFDTAPIGMISEIHKGRRVARACINVCCCCWFCFFFGFWFVMLEHWSID